MKSSSRSLLTIRFLLASICGCLIFTTAAAVAQENQLSDTSRREQTDLSYDVSVPEPTLSGVRYGKHERHVLDFWKASSESPTPLVLFIHGGSWIRGSKEKLHQVVDTSALLKAGISVVAINYRLMRHAKDVVPPVKAPLHDAARALQFIRSKAGPWNIDKDRIGAAGGSAGGCSSLWLAFHDDLAEPENSDPVTHESTRLSCAAVVYPQTTLDPKQMKQWTTNSSYGGHAFGIKTFNEFLAQRDNILPLISEYSPYASVSVDDPPTWLFYNSPPAVGEEQKDPTHTANFGVKLQERCEELGVDCKVVYPGSAETQFETPTDFLIATLSASKDEIEDSQLPAANDDHLRSESSESKYSVSATSAGIDVFDKDDRVLHYQLAPKSLNGKYARSNYIHPLFDLDGNVLTEDFPVDHRWHRGIFWAWHQVLIGDKRIGDQWICERFQWDVVNTSSIHYEDGSLSVRATLHWKSPDWKPAGEMKPFLEESVTLRLHPASENQRTIDFRLQFQSLVPNLRIGGSDNVKGYGGFSLRIKNPKELQFRGKLGTVEAKIRAVDAGKWLEISNRNNNRHNKVLVLTHKSQPNCPAPWILRNRQPAMQNVVYPGRHSRLVFEKPDSPLSLRYRLIIHRCEVDTNTIESWQASFESLPPHDDS